jgi:inorganic triphosphatase YgiF
MGLLPEPLSLTIPEKYQRKLVRDSWLNTAGRARRSRAHSVWFDTAGFALHHAGIKLSIIDAGGHLIQRVRLPDRAEILSQYVGNFRFSDIDLVRVRKKLEQTARRGLTPVFEIHSLARTWQLDRPECGAIAAKLIQGTFLVGAERHPFSELQLVPGDLERRGHYAAARHFIAGLGVSEEPFCLEDRGFELAGIKAPRPVLAGPSPVAPGQSCAQALRAIAQDCLTQFQCNEAAARHAEDPEYIHQMRVALRRLRSALRTFSPLLPPEALDRFATPLTRIFQATAGKWVGEMG